MRRHIGLVVPAGAGVVAAVLTALAVGSGGGGGGAAVLAALAVLLLAGTQVATVRQGRVLRQRMNRLAAAQRRAAAKAPAPRPAPAPVAPKPVPAKPDQTTTDLLGTLWVRHLPVPPDELRFIASENPERFVRHGREQADMLQDHASWPASSVLDVGSGYGRLAVGLLDHPDFTGTYLGFEILKRHITWCQKAITPYDERFQFRHMDVLNERYNPNGTVDPEEVVFPAEDDSADAITLFSVFTHMYRPTIERYLAEIRRTLRPGGVAVTTWLLFDEERLPLVTADTAAYPLTLAGDDGSRYMLEEDPLRAIGYPVADALGMIEKAGLTVARTDLGNWVGGPAAPGQPFQDILRLTKA